MKIPLDLPCPKCDGSTRVWIDLDETSIEKECSCGEDLTGYIGPDITVGFKALSRSRYELMDNKDHILSMVLSAAALEWEVARLYKKWMYIDALSENRDEFTQEEIEDLFRKNRTIFEKMQKTGRLLHPTGFEKYVAESEELRGTIEEGFPSLKLDTLLKDIQIHLFWPRNRILHFAFTGYSHEDAIKSYNIARLGLVILNSMDEYRRNTS